MADRKSVVFERLEGLSFIRSNCNDLNLDLPSWIASFGMEISTVSRLWLLGFRGGIADDT